MKKILTLILTLLTLTSFATKYYVSNSGNDSNPGTIPSPFKTLAKCQTLNTVLGDTLFLNNGSVFNESFIINKSNLVISSYGSGPSPIINGLTTLTSWTNSGTNLWYANLNTKANLNLVTINGIPAQIGRFPNTDAANGGYLTYNAVGGATGTAGGTATITSATTLLTNWVGATVVIRKKRWNLEKSIITSQIGNVIGYTQPTSGNIYSGELGFGFYVQNDIRTLDKEGEWFYDKTNNRLYLYTVNPNALTVKASIIDTVVSATNKSNVTIEKINVQGGNYANIYFTTCDNSTIKNVTSELSGRDAITLMQGYNQTVSSCTVNNALGSGILLRRTGTGISNINITDNVVKNVAKIGGMDISGDASGRAGITGYASTGVNILRNKLDSIGYLPIEFQGNNAIVRYNVINYFCFAKDDGGGIYTFSLFGTNFTRYTNRIIDYNIILNGVGNYFGTSYTTPSARGIYLDEGTVNVLVDYNTMYNIAGAALYGNSDSGITITNNVVHTCGYSYMFQRFENAPLVRGFKITNNTFYNFTAEYRNLQINVPSGLTIDQDVINIGIIDSNYIHNTKSLPITFITTNTGRTNGKTYTRSLTQFLTISGKEINSKSLTGTYVLVYNSDSREIVINLSGTWIDQFGIKRTNFILPPYRSLILKQVSTTVANNTIQLKYNLKT